MKIKETLPEMETVSNSLDSLYKEAYELTKNDVLKKLKQKFSRIYLKNFPVVIVHTNQDKKIDFYIGNYVYLAIDGHPYGLFKWENGEYVLQDHKDGNLPLILKKNLKYELVVKDFLKQSNLDYIKQLDDIKNIEDIQLAFAKFVSFDKKSELLKNKVLDYLYKIIVKEKLKVENRFITYVDDRYNRLFLFFANKNGQLKLIGYDKVSTGNPKRGKKYNKTPYLIIDRKELNLSKKDWYALGTDSKGYGPKGSRIYFLGKYFVSRDGKVSFIPKTGYRELHLAFHTTTPWGLTQLGKPMSMGCIRTSRFINVLYNNFPTLNEGIFIIGDVQKQIEPFNVKGKITK